MQNQFPVLDLLSIKRVNLPQVVCGLDKSLVFKRRNGTCRFSSQIIFQVKFCAKWHQIYLRIFLGKNFSRVKYSKILKFHILAWKSLGNIYGKNFQLIRTFFIVAKWTISHLDLFVMTWVWGFPFSPFVFSWVDSLSKITYLSYTYKICI